MLRKQKPLLELNATDLMSRQPVMICQDLPLREVAHLLLKKQISGAPVVDAAGRCIGVLCATDFVRWAEEGGHGAESVPLATCPYEVKGRLLTGDEAVICTMAEGCCPLQEMWPTTGGRHTMVCRQPSGVLSDWQQVTENLRGTVRHYMTADVVTVGPQTPLRQLARMMIDAHVHRVIVVDERRKPIGVVSLTDIAAAVAYAQGGDVINEESD
jgi:CBS domain-containing protein